MKYRPLFDRLIEKIDRKGPDECWPWLAFKSRGYGKIQVGPRSRYAHRIAYELWYGEKPGQVVMHTCDNPGCCNPHHLRSGTQAENNRDKAIKGRAPRMRGEAHPRARFTDEQVTAILEDPRSNAVIASQYGVAKSTIAMMRTGRTWRHIAQDRN